MIPLRRKYVARSSLLTGVQIDEMETYEHTRLNPLFISFSVTPDRFVIRADVATIPAKGRLSTTSHAMYGARPDGSGQAPERALGRVARMSGAAHEAVKSRTGAVAGTGEARAFDQMFTLNHMCAVMSSQMSSLNRRMCKGSKKEAKLQDELDLFVWWNNMGIMGLR